MVYIVTCSFITIKCHMFDYLSIWTQSERTEGLWYDRHAPCVTYTYLIMTMSTSSSSYIPVVTVVPTSCVAVPTSCWLLKYQDLWTSVVLSDHEYYAVLVCHYNTISSMRTDHAHSVYWTWYNVTHQVRYVWNKCQIVVLGLSETMPLIVNHCWILLVHETLDSCTS